MSDARHGRSGAAPVDAGSDRLLCAVLARGWTRRIDGDKAFLQWNGAPLIEHALAAHAALTTNLGPAAHRSAQLRPVIVTKRPEGYRDLGVPVIRDRFVEETPMSGILTAAAYAEEIGAEWILVSGADTIPTVADLYHRMWAARPMNTGALPDGTNNAPPAHPTHRSDNTDRHGVPRALLLSVNGVVQPIPGLYHRSAIVFWREAYHRAAFRLSPVAQSIPARYLAFDAMPYINVNTRDELPRSSEIA